MRYRDAAHVDLGSFYAREPRYGKTFRLVGYAVVVMACYFHNDPDILGRLLIALITTWLFAWYRVVGALWRSSVVAATVLCALLLTMHKVDAILAAAKAGVAS
jgi:hypothetical protein